MRVYIVLVYDPTDETAVPSVDGVFDSKEKAQIYISENKGPFKRFIIISEEVK